MALKLTAALRDAVLKYGGLANIMSNCVLKVYSGAQPATAETAPSGTLLCTYSSASGALTREVLSQGKVTFSGTVTGGTCTSITVNGLEILGATVTDATTVLADFATAVALTINRNPKNLLFRASASAGVVTLTANPGLGSLPNGWAVVSTVGTITKADVNMGSLTAGVTAVNGLNWGTVVGGVLPKHETQVWSGVALATGTAGWGRFEAAVSDGGGTDSSESIYRMDGDVATSGAVFNIGNTAFVVGITQTLGSFALTLPTG